MARKHLWEGGFWELRLEGRRGPQGVVRGVLDQDGVPHYCPRANPGQVRVDSRQLGAYLQRRRSQQTHDTSMHRTALQYMLVGLGASGIAASFLIPRILEHA